MKQQKSSIRLFAYLVLFALMAGSAYAAQPAVDLGTAGNFVILAKSGISTTGTTSINGDIGVSPIDSTAITGFGLIMDPSNQFATSSLVTGKVFAADYTSPTPTIMTAAVSDMETAYTNAAGRTLPDYTELGAGNIDGMTLTPGLYKWGTGVTIPNGVTLSGGSNDVWIFQIAQDLTVGNGAIVTLSGGAQAKNIFWQVAGETTLGTTSNVKGIILSKTAIVMNTGAKLNGRALAQTAVTLDANAVTAPTGSSTPTPTPTTATNTGSGSGTTSSGSSGGAGGESSQESETCTTSACGPDGIKTKTCTKSNGVTSKEKLSCTPAQASTPTTAPTKAAASTTAPKDASAEKSQTTQGIGQELNEQIRERKEEIKSGDYIGSLGQLLRVRELSQNLRELKVNDVSAQTSLNITAETDSKGKTTLKTKLKNGRDVEIKIMPDAASKKALEVLRVKTCSPANNCTIQLKNTGIGVTEQTQYTVQLERHSKILGIFQKKMHVEADINAETGLARVHKPWWAFLAVEPAE